LNEVVKHHLMVTYKIVQVGDDRSQPTPMAKLARGAGIATGATRITCDLRSLRAFLPGGSELGVRNTQGAWRVIPHTLTLGRKILKEKANRGHLRPRPQIPSKTV
jgi:hypothetical protein